MSSVQHQPVTEDSATTAAQKYVQQLLAFCIHASVAAGSLLLIAAVNLLTNEASGIAIEWGTLWLVWAFLGWLPGLAIHGLVVRLNRPSLSASIWEQRQIDKVLSS